MKEQIAMEKERVVVLLRASSKQQTDREHDFDIPQQKSILLPYVESQGWELVKVFTEGGISGFKISANNRDAIQDIKKMADKHEFDRLVIYMSDRLGRIADETPLILSYLNNKGIEVFSYGFRRTAQYLNDKGYRTRSGGLWTATQIRQIVNNPLYE